MGLTLTKFKGMCDGAGSYCFCTSLPLSLVSANSAKACYQFETTCAAEGKAR